MLEIFEEALNSGQPFEGRVRRYVGEFRRFLLRGSSLRSHPVPMHPYRLDINHGTITIDAVPLRFIGLAYQYQPERVKGGPEWLNDARYDIEAKTQNPNAMTDEIRAMLRVLLAASNWHYTRKPGSFRRTRSQARWGTG